MIAKSWEYSGHFTVPKTRECGLFSSPLWLLECGCDGWNPSSCLEPRGTCQGCWNSKKDKAQIPREPGVPIPASAHLPLPPTQHGNKPPSHLNHGSFVFFLSRVAETDLRRCRRFGETQEQQMVQPRWKETVKGKTGLSSQDRKA